MSKLWVLDIASCDVIRLATTSDIAAMTRNGEYVEIVLDGREVCLCTVSTDADGNEFAEIV